MGALFLLVQAELCPSNNDLNLVGDIQRHHLVNAQRTRHTVDDGEHVRTEAGLQLGVFVQVVQHHTRYGVALELDDDTHAPLQVRFVINRGNALQTPVLDLIRDVGNHAVRVDLVRQLSDDNRLTSALLLNRGHTAHANRATAGGVGLLDALIADNLGGSWEIRALDALHDRIQRGLFIRFRVVQAPVDGIRDLTQVVRRDVGGHTDGNTAGTVH